MCAKIVVIDEVLTMLLKKQYGAVFSTSHGICNDEIQSIYTSTG